MERVAAAMTKADPNLDEKRQASRLEYQKAITKAIAEMKTP